MYRLPGYHYWHSDGSRRITATKNHLPARGKISQTLSWPFTSSLSLVRRSENNRDMEQSITVVWRAHHAETVEHWRMSLHQSITIPLQLLSNFGARATSCPLVCSVVATYSSSRSSKRFYHNQHSLDKYPCSLIERSVYSNYTFV